MDKVQQFKQHLLERIVRNNVTAIPLREESHYLLLVNGVSVGNVQFNSHVIRRVLEGHVFADQLEILLEQPLCLTQKPLGHVRGYLHHLSNDCDVGKDLYWVRFIPATFTDCVEHPYNKLVLNSVANWYCGLYVKSDITDF